MRVEVQIDEFLTLAWDTGEWASLYLRHLPQRKSLCTHWTWIQLGWLRNPYGRSEEDTLPKTLCSSQPCPYSDSYIDETDGRGRRNSRDENEDVEFVNEECDEERVISEAVSKFGTTTSKSRTNVWWWLRKHSRWNGLGLVQVLYIGTGKLRKNTKNLRTDCAAVSSSGCTVSNGRIVSEQLNTKTLKNQLCRSFW